MARAREKTASELTLARSTHSASRKTQKTPGAAATRLKSEKQKHYFADTLLDEVPLVSPETIFRTRKGS